MTFVFVILLLQYSKICTADTPPVLNADRLFIEEYFYKDGAMAGFINPQDLSLFENSIAGKELFGINCQQIALVRMNEQYKSTTVEFVGKDYFDIYQFEFVEGRAFTREEAEAGDKKAVIKKELAKRYFPNGSVVGKKIVVQNIEYEVIGVVDDFSKFAAPNIEGAVWVPYKYNKGVPSGSWWYKVNILFKPGIPQKEMQRQLADAVQAYFSNLHREVDFDEEDAVPFREVKAERTGLALLPVGIGGIISLLLLIPALNIIVLNMINTYAHAAEIAIRRAIGSSKRTVFSQQMMKIFILVLVGLLIGILLALPVTGAIQNLVFGNASQEEMMLIAHLDYSVILFQVLPLAVVFAFLSGGLPVFLVTNKNIAFTLKGEGDKQ